MREVFDARNCFCLVQGQFDQVGMADRRKRISYLEFVLAEGTDLCKGPGLGWSSTPYILSFKSSSRSTG